MTFKDDDLKALLFENDSASGEYSFTSWKVQNSDETITSEMRRLVTLHESFHSSLNDSTAFGTILQCESYLYRNLPHQKVYSRRLNHLIDSCRKTHECYATYLSILIVSNTKDCYLPNPERLLQNNYTYLDYYQTMNKLCSPFKGGYLRYHACVSIARVCMQSHAIYTYINNDTNSFTVADITLKDLPDERLRYIHKNISVPFWEKTWDEIQVKFKDHPGIIAVLRHEKDPGNSDLYNEAYNVKYDNLSLEVMKYFQYKLSELLKESNYKTLDYDEHKELTNSCLNKCYDIIPKNEAIAPIESAEEHNFNEVSDVLEDYENECYIVTNKKIKARLLPLFDSKENSWLNPICDVDEHPHYFLIARLLSRLLDQYDLGKDLQIDGTLTDEIHYFFRRSIKNEDERIVELFIINTPEQLTQFIEDQDGNSPIYSNITMRALSSEYHLNTWYKSIIKYSFPTILFDLSPFLNFKTWKEQNSFNVKFNSIELQIDNKKHYCFACQLLVDGDLIFISPCSLMICHTLKYYLRELIDSKIFTEDQEFLNNNSKALSLVLSHLIREERYFDFKATKKNYNDSI